MDKKYKNGTKCLIGGYTPGNGEPRQIPIIQSTTFKYDTIEAMGDLFDLKASGYFYSRLQNPTNDFVANKIKELEGGVAAMLTSSGQAANFFAILNLAGAGDHIVCSSEIYGGTYNLFNVTMRRMGIDFTFVSPSASDDEINNAFKENTKALFGETIANPALSVLDIERFASIAHSHGVPFIIDNTFATPILCKPFKWGADIVVHSTTKYMDGHGVSLGGCIVDSGNFDFSKYKEKFPEFNEPDESYHGVIYSRDFGKGAYITKATVQLMRDLGAIQSPQNAFYINLGLESLNVRMKKHSKSALKIAEYLKSSDKVSWVKYPGLEGDQDFELSKKYLEKGQSGVICFGVKGGREAASKFMSKLELCNIATHVADARTCVLHPASTTHRQLSDKELELSGVKADQIRLSVGLECTKDLISDIENALNN